MFIHNLTVALRNLSKYKTQSIVSILGLAAGFACFSLTAMWIRYENSYDRFQPKGDRIYRIVMEDKEDAKGYYEFMPDPMGDYMKSHFPEVEEVSLVRDMNPSGLFAFKDAEGERKGSINITGVDSGFIKMFDLPRELITQLQPSQSGKQPIAIVQSMADMFAGKGKSPVNMLSEPGPKQFEIQGVLPEWERTEIRFQALAFNYEKINFWNTPYLYVYVLLKEGADGKAFMQKVKEAKVDAMPMNGRSFMAVPLHDMHRVMPSDQSNMRTKYEHIRIFALAGAMVILCALFNYLVLFITRLKMRGRELALRKVNGASDSSLMGTLLLEFGLVLLMALFIGECMVELSLSFFKEVSRANMEPMDIYKETLFFAILLYVITLLLCALPIYYFRRKTLYAHLHGKIENGVRNIFQKIVLVSQILMSAIMIVATTVIFLQVRYLQNQSLGLNPHNIHTIKSWVGKSSDLSPLAEKLKQLPSVADIAITHDNFFPNCTYDGFTEVKQEGAVDPTPVYIMHCFTDAHLFEMAEIRLLEGRYYRPEEMHEVVINESAKKLLGEKGTPGNQVDGHTIVGIVADCFTESPLLPAKPTIYRNIMDRDGFSDYTRDYGRITATIKLKEGVMQKSEDVDKFYKAINDLVKKNMQDQGPSISDWKQSYEDIFLNSEKNLAKLFSIVSIICLLISIFGIYSLASLTCEQRRKEIAIRKINGATMRDILNLFFKEFFILLGIALVIAFPIGYYVMSLWLEQYTRRVPMGLPLFLGVALSLALVIMASIFLRVWRAASANPAEVVKENN